MEAARCFLRPNFIMRDTNGPALSYVFCVLSADQNMTPPLHACGAPYAALRQDQSKCVGNSMGVCDCEADAGSRNIKDSALLKQATIHSNPGIIVAPAAGRSTAIIVAPASDAKCKDTHAEVQANPSTHDNLQHRKLLSSSKAN